MPPRRKRGPPCVNTDSCADVNTDGGQWTYLPEPFLDAHPGQYDKDDCYCKRAACREFVGVKSAPMKPWGKRTLTAVSCTAMAMGRELGRQSLPRPPFLVQIKEIWGERSPRPCLPLSCACSHSCARIPLLGRHCNFENWDDVDRGNKLNVDRAEGLEYAVLGVWKRREGDEQDTHGVWYMGVPELLRAVGKADLDEALDAYEAARKTARTDAQHTAEEAEEAEREAEREAEEEKDE